MQLTLYQLYYVEKMLHKNGNYTARLSRIEFKTLKQLHPYSLACFRNLLKINIL